MKKIKTKKVLLKLMKMKKINYQIIPIIKKLIYTKIQKHK